MACALRELLQRELQKQEDNLARLDKEIKELHARSAGLQTQATRLERESREVGAQFLALQERLHKAEVPALPAAAATSAGSTQPAAPPGQKRLRDGVPVSEPKKNAHPRKDHVLSSNKDRVLPPSGSKTPGAGIDDSLGTDTIDADIMLAVWPPNGSAAEATPGLVESMATGESFACRTHLNAGLRAAQAREVLRSREESNGQRLLTASSASGGLGMVLCKIKPSRSACHVDVLFLMVSKTLSPELQQDLGLKLLSMVLRSLPAPAANRSSIEGTMDISINTKDKEMTEYWKGLGFIGFDRTYSRNFLRGEFTKVPGT